MIGVLGHPGTSHAVEERRLDVGVGRVQLHSVSEEKASHLAA
jgi:hypothetical protein